MERKARLKKKSNTKAEIISKACQIIKREGVENFTVQQLIAKLEIGVGTFYYYFSSKEMLLFETLVFLDEQFVEMFKVKYHDISSNAEKLKLFLHEQAMVASNITAQHLDNYRRVLKKNILTYYFNAKISPKYQMLIDIMEDGQAQNEFTRAFPAKALAELVWTTMAGAADFSRISELYDIATHTDQMGEILAELVKKNSGQI